MVVCLCMRSVLKLCSHIKIFSNLLVISYSRKLDYNIFLSAATFFAKLACSYSARKNIIMSGNSHLPYI